MGIDATAAGLAVGAGAALDLAFRPPEVGFPAVFFGAGAAFLPVTLSAVAEDAAGLAAALGLTAEGWLAALAFDGAGGLFAAAVLAVEGLVVAFADCAATAGAAVMVEATFDVPEGALAVLGRSADLGSEGVAAVALALAAGAGVLMAVVFPGDFACVLAAAVASLAAGAASLAFPLAGFAVSAAAFFGLAVPVDFAIPMPPSPPPA